MLLVEGANDQLVARQVLQLAGVSDVTILAASGPARLERATKMHLAAGTQVAVLVDADRGYGLDTSTRIIVEDLRTRWGIEDAVEVFVAVPEIEAWLLADPEVLPRDARLDATRTPDGLGAGLARRLARQYLRGHQVPGYWDLNRAMRHSPSLRNFVDGMRKLSGGRDDPKPRDSLTDIRLQQSFGSHPTFSEVTRREIMDLIRSTFSGEQMAWKTTNEVVTANRLIRELQDGTPLADEYIEAILRVSIAFMARQAKSAE